MLKSVTMWKIHISPAFVERATVVIQSPVGLLSGVTNTFSPAIKTLSPASVCCAPPVVCQLCRRYTSLSAKTSGKISFSLCQSFLPISAQSQTRFHKLHPEHELLSLLRPFATWRTSSADGHRRAGFSSSWDKANRTTVTYMAALAVAVMGLSYAAVPLYRIFCQASGYGGTVNVVDPGEKVKTMEPLRERELTIRFNADTSAAMRWQFKPHQKEIKLVPGETALAFYTAKNPSDEPVTGIATYNVIPFEAGLYFNKIQCFCFEEQRLNPREQVDMPVFFYIDPEFNEDPAMAKVDTITLSYTFFEAKEGERLTLPLPQTS